MRFRIFFVIKVFAFHFITPNNYSYAEINDQALLILVEFLSQFLGKYSSWLASCQSCDSAFRTSYIAIVFIVFVNVIIFQKLNRVDFL